VEVRARKKGGQIGAETFEWTVRVVERKKARLPANGKSKQKHEKGRLSIDEHSRNRSSNDLKGREAESLLIT